MAGECSGPKPFPGFIMPGMEFPSTGQGACVFRRDALKPIHADLSLRQTDCLGRGPPIFFWRQCAVLPKRELGCAADAGEFESGIAFRMGLSGESAIRFNYAFLQYAGRLVWMEFQGGKRRLFFSRRQVRGC